MQVFETLRTVTNDDIDELNHVNNVRYVEWVNDVAKLHWQQNTSKKINNNYYWVLLSHNIDYKSSAYLNEVITLKTYIAKSEGVKSIRIIEMYNSKTNKLLVKSETHWCLMNAKTNRPTRITEEISNLFK